MIYAVLAGIGATTLMLIAYGAIIAWLDNRSGHYLKKGKDKDNE
jgi:hypothetical protein